MSAFAQHFSFEFRAGLRNRMLLFLNYLFPLGFYVLMGSLMGQINPMFVDTMIPGMVVFAVIAAALLGLPDPHVSAREAGIFRSYKINGVPTLSILFIPALTTILHLAVVAAIITASAPLLFEAPSPLDWASFVLVFLALTLVSVGLGVLFGVISPTTRTTVLWSQLVFLPSMVLGGIMLPYGMLPQALKRVALLLPTSHAMNAFRGLAMGYEADFDPWASVATLLISGGLALWLCIRLFNWDRRNPTRRGHPALAVLVLLPYAVGAILFV